MREPRGPRWCWLWTALLVLIASTGCTRALIQPMPEVKGPLGLAVSKETASNWSDMPIGVHQIPETSIYVSGHQGRAGIGVMFGLLGLAAAHAAAKSTGENKSEAIASLRLDVTALTERVLREELERRADAGRFATRDGATDHRLEIVPYVVLTFVGEERVRPWAVLKTSLRDRAGNEKWKTRYLAAMDEPRRLDGEAGWAAADGQPLREAIDRALRAAVDVLLRDAQGLLVRGKGRAARVKTDWAFVKERVELDAEVLEETEQTLVVKPEVGDAIVFAGINVIPRQGAEVTPREK